MENIIDNIIDNIKTLGIRGLTLVILGLLFCVGCVGIMLLSALP